MELSVSNLVFTLFIFFGVFSASVSILLLFAFKNNEKYSADAFALGCLLAGLAALSTAIRLPHYADTPYRVGLFFTTSSWVCFIYSYQILLGNKISFKRLVTRSLLFGTVYVILVKVLFDQIGFAKVQYLVGFCGIVFNFILAFLSFKTYQKYQLSVALPICATHLVSIVLYFFVQPPEVNTVSNLICYGAIIGLILLRYVGMFSLLASVESIAKGELMVENHLIRAELASNKLKQSEEQFLVTLNALASARDNETGNHIVRTQNYVKIIAVRLKENGHYTDYLTDDCIDLLFKAAPLHDIGKVGIPDSILLKGGPLNPEEWEIMKTHALIGESVLGAANPENASESKVIAKAIKIAGGHHEKWDGTGYPRGLAGEAIPLEARIMALADVYDALISDRPYKKAWSHEEAYQYILSKRRTQFEPLIVDAFIVEAEAFQRVAQQYMD